MRTDKALAVKLRLQGKSYTEIQRELGKISKATLSMWLKDILLSSQARKLILKRTREKSLKGLIKRNKQQTILAQQRKNLIIKTAKSEVRKMSQESLFFVGLSLYWAEGYKMQKVVNGRQITSHPLGMTNSDPELIKIYLLFIRKICKVPEKKIKAHIRIFKHMNEKKIRDFWVRKTGILSQNFSRSTVVISKSSMGKRPFHRLPFGVIQIRINDTQLFHRIIGWIEGMKSCKKPR